MGKCVQCNAELPPRVFGRCEACGGEAPPARRNADGPALILGNKEFGEVYHAALAMIYDPKLRIMIETGRRTPVFRRFLELVLDTAQATEPRRFIYDDRLIEGAVENRAKKPGAAPTPYVPRERNITRTTNAVVAAHNGGGANRNPGAVLNALRQKMTTSCHGFIYSRLSRLAGSNKPRILVWIRSDKENQTFRNTTAARIANFSEIVRSVGCEPVYIGAPPQERPADFHDDLVEFYNEEDLFAGEDSVIRQLTLFHNLKSTHRVIAQIGMQSGGMDGPAFFVGLPTISMVHKGTEGRTPKLSGEIIPTYHTFVWATGTADDANNELIRQKLRPYL